MEGKQIDQTFDQHCSDEQLIEMIGSQSNADHYRKLLEHVEACSQCQEKLEQLAADSTLWSDAAIALTGYSSSDKFHGVMPTMQLHGLLHNHQQATNWTEAMARQLLAAPSHPEMLGRIGRYEVERLIGSGGMGIVFKAIDSELNRTVAIKLLAPYLAGNGSARQRFSREAKAAAAVVHEHVVPIHNVETDGNCPYLVMRYVAGESLQQRIDREGPLDTCQVLRIAKQIAAGLAAAHVQGLIHRDIKPSNILVESGVERSLITDFGLARAADDASLTNTGYHPGTPQYMSPEQARGDSIDARSDLFSLGSLMYTMCTGRAPFRAETSYGILRKITDTEPLAIQEINPNIPRWLSAIIGKLMAKAPEDRIQTASELEALLGGCLAHVQRPTVHELPRLALELGDRAGMNSGPRATGRFTPRNWLSLGALFMVTVMALVFLFNRNFRQFEARRKVDTVKREFEPIVQQRNQPNRVSSTRMAAPPTAADLLRQKLTQPAMLAVKDATIADTLKQLFTNSKIDFEINQQVFQEAGREKDLSQTISISASGTARDLLNRALMRIDAAYIVRDRYIEIVTVDHAKHNPVLRQYDLAFAMKDNSSLVQLNQAIESMFSSEDRSGLSGSYSISTVESILMVRSTEAVHSSIERLLAHVNTTFQPSQKN